MRLNHQQFKDGTHLWILSDARKRTIVPTDTAESEVGMSMGDLLFGGDRELHQSSTPATNHRPSQEEDGYFSP